MIEGYGAVGQLKWAVWRRKEKVEEISEERLDEDQMVKVIAALDPVFANGPGQGRA